MKICKKQITGLPECRSYPSSSPMSFCSVCLRQTSWQNHIPFSRLFNFPKCHGLFDFPLYLIAEKILKINPSTYQLARKNLFLAKNGLKFTKHLQILRALINKKSLPSKSPKGLNSLFFKKSAPRKRCRKQFLG